MSRSNLEEVGRNILRYPDTELQKKKKEIRVKKKKRTGGSDRFQGFLPLLVQGNRVFMEHFIFITRSMFASFVYRVPPFSSLPRVKLTCSKGLVLIEPPHHNFKMPAGSSLVANVLMQIHGEAKVC